MRHSAFVATKRVGRRFKFVFCQTVLAVPLHLGQTYYPWPAFPPYHGDGFNFFDDTPVEIDEDVLVLSLGSGGIKRLQKQLPSARPGPFENTLRTTPKRISRSTSGRFQASRGTSPTTFSNRPTGLRDCPKFSRSVSRIA